MNVVEHLLTVMGEEGGEVAKECSKALRFGLNDRLTLNPEGPRGTDGPTNREKIAAELNDVLGMAEMLVDHGILPRNWQDLDAQRRKRVKVARYMDYAKRCGTLTP